MKYLFIGEDPSDLSIRMGVTWEDGKLAAKQLFDALRYCGINPKECEFTNAFHRPNVGLIVKYATGHNHVIVGMGRKVQQWLEEQGIEHLFIYHPAARGKIRKKEVYCEHVKSKLIG